MTPKTQKAKDRRRARTLPEQACEAVHADHPDLAEKIVRRAGAVQVDNPALCVDQGMILGLRGKEAESADAFRAAISLAPTFAEPYARLAALRIRQGFTSEAVALQTQAVKHAPDNAAYAEQFSAYQALADSEKPPSAQPAPDPQPPAESESLGDWPERLAAFDWQQLGERLTRDGCVLIERLVDAAHCEELCSMFDRDELFAKTVVMDRPEFGQGVYKYFRAPIPTVVNQLR